MQLTCLFQLQGCGCSSSRRAAREHGRCQRAGAVGVNCNPPMHDIAHLRALSLRLPLLCDSQRTASHPSTHHDQSVVRHGTSRTTAYIVSVFTKLLVSYWR